eukprot:gnl/TRDRNA2_/TRDRNA2_184927_c0_seq1.p1 gnl/TRDRNA2_/TRDRNA2_184927_c0~~gnl/TRDRNA2_/TRDRNA2_184927_c0_seq1.p1  ORF type:complete len:268 (+),score=37.65 gnl/TRDRNA2_/TRDRNA2_184927_c0_seq1:76-879(+)
MHRCTYQVFAAFTIWWTLAAGDADCSPPNDISDDITLMQLHHRRRKHGSKKHNEVTSVPETTSPASNATATSQAAAVSSSYSSPLAAIPAGAAASLASNATPDTAVSSSTLNASATQAAAPVAAAVPASSAVMNAAAAPTTAVSSPSSNASASHAGVSTASRLALRLKNRLDLSDLGPGASRINNLESTNVTEVAIGQKTSGFFKQVVATFNLLDFIEGILAPVGCVIAGGLTFISGLTWFLQFAGDLSAGVIVDNAGVSVPPWHVW